MAAILQRTLVFGIHVFGSSCRRHWYRKLPRPAWTTMRRCAPCEKCSQGCANALSVRYGFGDPVTKSHTCRSEVRHALDLHDGQDHERRLSSQCNSTCIILTGAPVMRLSPRLLEVARKTLEALIEGHECFIKHMMDWLPKHTVFTGDCLGCTRSDNLM